MEDFYRYLGSGVLTVSGQGRRTYAQLCAMGARAMVAVAIADREAAQDWMACQGRLRHERTAFLRELRRRDQTRAGWLQQWAESEGLLGGAEPPPEQPVPGPVRPRVAPGRPSGDYRTCVALPTAGRLLSGFGERRSRQHPDVFVMHGGADYAGALGTPVVAAADGIVEHATANGARGFGGYGRVVVLKHPQMVAGGETTRTLYAHLDGHSVERGERVEAGQQIGTVGNTDGSVSQPGSTFPQTAERQGREAFSNPHLHFEVAQGRYPRPAVSQRTNPRAERKDPELWLGSFPSCAEPEERPERGPPDGVSSHEPTRPGGFPLWAVFLIGLGLALAAKGKS